MVSRGAGSSAGMAGDADVLNEVDGIHFRQLYRAGNGIENAHGHSNLDIALRGAGSALLDEQGKGGNQHGVRLARNARGEAVIMGDHKGGLLVLDPVLKDNCMFCNIANSFFILFSPLFIYFGCSRRREQGFPNALLPR